MPIQELSDRLSIASLSSLRVRAEFGRDNVSRTRGTQSDIPRYRHSVPSRG